jgi:carbonic anhydrase
MKIKSLIIICLITLMTQQKLDYSGSELGWNCVGNAQSPVDLPIDSSYYADGRNLIKLLSTNYTLINATGLSVNQSNKFGFVFNTPSGFLNTLINNKVNVRYNLNSLLIHVGSEHTLGGNRYDAEIQIIHQKDLNWLQSQSLIDPDPSNPYLIVSILLKFNQNIPNNKYLDQFNIYDSSPVTNMDLSPFINVYQDYFYYQGSFTIPACTQNVNWVIMRNPQIISYRQLYALTNWIEQLYPAGNNSRKAKPLNGRNLYYINRNGRKFIS